MSKDSILGGKESARDAECLVKAFPRALGSHRYGEYSRVRPGAQGRDARDFYVRSATVSRCPVCAGTLGVIGSRARTRRTATGERQVLVIRRLRCHDCHRIHHELPTCLLPHKRYDSDSWEAVATAGPAAAVAVDEGTLRRWAQWLTTWVTIARRIWAALAAHAATDPGDPWPVALQGPPPWPTAPPGWLAVVVHELVQHAQWPQTRSAWVS